MPLPDRPLPPRPTATRPGYPLYIPGKVQQKSPIPPWPDRQVQKGEDLPCGLKSLLAEDMPEDFDYRATPADMERYAFNDRPLPAELFTRNRLAKQQTEQWVQDPTFEWNGERQVCHDVAVAKQRIEYNGHGWHDKDGHLFYWPKKEIRMSAGPDGRPLTKEPLFFRANHGQIVNLVLENRLPKIIGARPST